MYLYAVEGGERMYALQGKEPRERREERDEGREGRGGDVGGKGTHKSTDEVGGIGLR